MRVLLRWRGPGAQDIRLRRFRHVLRAARRTERYRPVLDAAGFCSPRDIARLSSVEEGLSRLPYVNRSEFEVSPDAFRNPGASAPSLARIRFPAKREMRTAVLDHRFAESKVVRSFASGSIAEIRQFSPEAIAAPAAVLMQLAEMARRHGEVFPALARVIAFTGPAHSTLSEQDRNDLWSAFEVPIFEQCLGPGGAVLAWECEAHDGLHIVEENVIVEQDASSGLILTCLTGYRYPAIRVVAGCTANVEKRACGCGHAGPRLTGLAMC